MGIRFDGPRTGLAATVAIALLLLPFVPLLNVDAVISIPLKFFVEEETVDYYVMDDGSAQVSYLLTIYVLADSPPLTTLNLPMPNYDFKASDVSAARAIPGNDRPVEGIKKSTRSETTVVITLGDQNEVRGGMNGTFLIKVLIDKAVFKSDKGSGQAMVEYSPMWWDRSTTPEVWSFTFRFHLPKGLSDISSTEGPGHTMVWWEPRENRTIYEWSYRYHDVGRSPSYECHFPASAVGRVYDEFWDLEFPRFLPFIIAATVLIVSLATILTYIKTRRRPYERPALKIEMRGADPDLGPFEAALVKGLPDDTMARMAVADMVDRDILVVDVPSPLRVRLLNPPTGTSLHDVPSAPLLKCLSDGALVEAHAREVIATMRDRASARMRGFDRVEALRAVEDRTEVAWDRIKGRKVMEHDDGLWMMLAEDARHRFRKEVEGGFPDWTQWALGWKLEEKRCESEKKEPKKGKKKSKEKKKEKKRAGEGAI